MVDSDLTIPTELGAVRVVIRDQENLELTRHVFSLVSNFDERTDEQFVLPISFAILRPEDKDTSLITIDVEALRAVDSQTPFLSRRAVTSFVEGTSLWLPIFLFRSCVNVDCSDEQTCVDNQCVPSRVDETLLKSSSEEGEKGVMWPDASVRSIFDAQNVDAEPSRDSGLDLDQGLELDVGTVQDAAEPVPDGGIVDGGLEPCAWRDETGTCDEAAQIIAGTSHTCAIRESGKVVCWGKNNKGQLGTWNQWTYSHPQPIYGTSTALALAVGAVHSCMIVVPGGGIKCWGSNAQGQLGNGTSDAFSSRPVDVNQLPAPAISISAGAGHTCAVLQNGETYCWGANDYGELGVGTTVESRVPVKVPGISDATTISSGNSHSCVITQAEEILCWGQNEFGQLGDGTLENRSSPVSVTSLAGVIEMDAGDRHTCARTRTSSGTPGQSRTFCWGSNEIFATGVSSQTSFVTTPVERPGLADAAELNAGWHTNCVRMTSGEVQCWGNNREGTLGDGTTTSTSALRQVIGLSDAQSITVGGGHACAIRTSKDVVCWGMNTAGQLGNDVRVFSDRPVPVAGLSDAASVVAGYRYTCTRRTNGVVSCAGANEWGKLGDNCGGQTCYLAFRSTLANVQGLSDATALSLGSYHSCATRNNGELACWGRNTSGELGLGSVGGFNDAPQTVTSIQGTPSAVTTSMLYHSCALIPETGSSDTGVWCWGAVPHVLQSSLPTRVSSFSTDGVEIVSGNEHTCIRTSRGTVECLGGNDYGQLGNGATISSSVAVQSSGLTDVVQISAGNYHTCALHSNGNSHCWGRNYSGQLGSGTNVDSPNPISVMVTGLKAIAAGGYSTCGLKNSGTVSCWGSNTKGQLGLGRRSATESPSLIPGLTDVESLSLGNAHACARRITGEAQCWGQNEHGELSDGRFFRSLTPQLVSEP